MKHVLQGINIINFLQKFWKKLKLSEKKNSYLRNSVLNFARLCACKSLIYLNIYKSRDLEGKI